MGHKLGTGFAVGIGIKPVQRLLLPIAPALFIIFIDLVGSHIDQAFHRICLPDAFQQIDSTHYIRFIGKSGI